MKTDAKLTVFLITSVALLSFVGCTDPQGQGWLALPFISTQSRQADISAQRFQPAGPQGPTAVQSAVELSEKYAKLSDEASAFKQQNQQLDTENAQLKDQLGTSRSQLQQAQKELDEANDLLLEMRLELNNWKNDVIGFRDEMRDAEKAQLEALLKVLKLMGAEVRTQAPESTEPAGGTENLPTPQQTRTPGEQK